MPFVPSSYIPHIFYNMMKINESKGHALQILKEKYKLDQKKLDECSLFLDDELQAKKLVFALLQVRFMTRDIPEVNIIVANSLPSIMEMMEENHDIDKDAIIKEMVFQIIHNGMI